MKRQRELRAVFLGHGQELVGNVFSELEARGIQPVQFDELKDFDLYFQEKKESVGAFVLGPGGPDGGWEQLAELLHGRGADYVPLIDTGGGAIIPEAMRLKRLVYSIAQPIDPAELATTIQVAFLEHLRYRDLIKEVESRSSAIGTIMAGIFEVKSVTEAKNLTTMLSLACPNPKSAAFVLSELLINAIEHGNLGISYEEKSELVARGEWSSEVERRLAMPENADKKVTVQFDRDATRTVITIMDKGDGFDWRKFTGPLSEEGKRRFSGRGITMAKAMEGCDIQYKGTGSVVTIEMGV